MSTTIERLIAIGASSLGVLLLSLSYELWSELTFNTSRWNILAIGLSMLGAGTSAGVSLSVLGPWAKPRIATALLAAGPFALIALYFLYWLSPLPNLGASQWLERFVVSEPVFLGAYAIVGVFLGGALGSRLATYLTKSARSSAGDKISSTTSSS